MNGFREKFAFPTLTSVNWFPGHMAKGLRVISQKMKQCDCVVEVHDARIPFSGRNPKFNLMLRGRPKVLVLNKVDLCDSYYKEDVLRELKNRGESEVLYTNLRSQRHPTIRELRSLILRVTNCNEPASKEENFSLRFMVVGMPNVGKSSLINALRRNYLKKGKGTSVGKLPGITKAVSTKIKVCDRPPIFLVDTPGVMKPSMPSDEVVMKLALTGMLKDNVVGEQRIADYLLFMMNRSENFEYATYCGMDSPSDDILVVLDNFSQRIGALQKGGSYDHVRASQHFLKRFRDGLLGQLTLDGLPRMVK